MTKMNKVMCLGALAAVLLAGSCAAPMNDASITADPETNHPITVAPDMRTLRVSYVGDGMSTEEAAKFDDFVAGYQARGNGSISISAPSGPGAAEAIRFFGERLAHLGVPRSRILVGTHDVSGGDSRVEVSYVAYVAHTEHCDDPWGRDVSETASNLPPSNFGCATQHNIAAMVADPRDLMGPRTMGQADATRRTTVVGKYEKGDVTAASKSPDQQANVSQMSNN
ncbi:MAG TPA: CpaD family pilus assembly protein [Rhizomicrobium sp.]|nr:CpaD family pilus assembly protein [Rhizomicrobium sp.]